MPTQHEEKSVYLQQQRAYTADRYGGYGVGYCGGSARCGNFGGIQIKGIGLTPLHGSRPGSPIDPWHSSGTATMNEAGREAIWSSICKFALPHGAVQTLAVVLTGTKCLRTDGAPGIEVFNRRALIMRELALRPAHFMRNVHFKTPLMPDMGICEDALRVRQMIRSLPDALGQAFGNDVRGGTATERVSQGMQAMARRFAAQVAAAFAKRLYHGSLNCTNIALDGRYLDFGTMTTVNAYRRQAGSPLWPDQWSQHTPLLRTLSYLLFQIGKHLEDLDTKTLVSTTELIAEFNSTLRNRSEIEMLKQTGVPEQAIVGYEPAARSRAYRCLKDIYSRGAHTSFVWRGEDDPGVAGVQSLRSLGRYDLNHILTQTALCSNAGLLRATVNTLIDDVSLATEFHTVYSDLVEWYLSTQPGMDSSVTRQFLAREATRRNADVSHLTREALDTAMSVFEEDPSGLGAYIDNTIRCARHIMEDEPPKLAILNGQLVEGHDAQLRTLGQMAPPAAISLLVSSPLPNATVETNVRPGGPCATV